MKKILAAAMVLSIGTIGLAGCQQTDTSGMEQRITDLEAEVVELGKKVDDISTKMEMMSDMMPKEHPTDGKNGGNGQPPRVK